MGRALPVVLMVGILLNGLRLRQRVSGLRTLPAPEPGAAGDGSAGPGGVTFGALVASGVTLDDATAAAATAFAREQSVDLVELVPAHLSTEQAFDFVRVVDPEAWRTDLFGSGRGAGYAVVARTDLLERAAVVPAQGLTTGQVVASGTRLKQFALRSADMAVAPSLPVAPYDPRTRGTALRAAGVPVAAALALPMVAFGLLVVATILRPAWGIAAFALWSFQPVLVFGGGQLAPTDLGRAAALRVVREPMLWFRTVAGGRGGAGPDEAEKEAAAAELATAKAAYALELAEGTDRFFEPRRSSCPWCGADDLRRVLGTGDRFQQKPGRFTLDRCRGCGHVFQNPCLSLAGLEFYYRDFYDGFGAPAADFVFRTGTYSYRQRAEMLRTHATPARWLDVGAGHAHFCVVAHDRWPDTAFDGLDMGVAIEEAEAKGWVGRGYRGQFVELADELAGRYDVVSMHHYLEHTRDPRDELDAAARVVVDGGLLLVEVPDPEWRLARVLGAYWVSWLQPQHQHLLPIDNLKQALVERGFTPIAERRGAAHQGNDFMGAALMVGARIWPDVRSPWTTRRPTAGRRVQSATAVVVGAPLLAVGIFLDLVANPFIRRGGRGNAYRVLARKEPPPGAPSPDALIPDG